MRRLLIALALLASPLSAQQWSGIVAPSRAVDWTAAGVPGGIPSANWTRCGSVIAPYGSSGSPGDPTTIQNAINACGSNQYVELGAGTFYLGQAAGQPAGVGGLSLKSNMAIRGQGADKTFVIFTAHNGCAGLFPGFCISGGTNPDFTTTYYGSPTVQPGGTNAGTWTAGFSQGTTSITVTNVGTNAIHNGQYVNLDQRNDTADNGSLFICDNTTPACSLEGGAPGRTIGGVDYNQIQIVKVVSGCSSPCSGAGPFVLTITPGLYALNFRIGQTPGVWFAPNIVNAGVENLSSDVTNKDGGSCSTCAGSVGMFHAFGCWVSGVRSLYGSRNHVVFWESAHNTVQNSYFFGTQTIGSQSYGVESFISSDNLVVNNIFQTVTAPVVLGPAQGNVYAYNFSRNDVYITPTWLQQAYAFGHDAGILYNLFEGNNGSGFWADVFHGSSGFNTVFRSFGSGFEPGKTASTSAYQVESYNRFYNVIGSVLGTAGFNTTYQTSAGTGAHNVVYDLGAGNSNGTVTVPADPLVTSTLFRWGNWDSATNTVRFQSSEVPSGIGAPYANAVPASHTLPNSFYYASKPSFFNATDVWPPIGSDLTPMIGVNPANRCYNTISGGTDPNGTNGGPYTFNASTCYPTQVVPPPPGAPTNLTASVSVTTVTLNWTAPVQGPVSSYNVYRGTIHGGPYTLLQSGVAGTSYQDTAVPNGTWFYTVTAVNAGGESAKSNEAQASVSGTLTVTLLPSSRTFANQTVGTPSASQTAVLTNTSGAGNTVTISSKLMSGANSGDYSFTDNCPSLLMSGLNCTFNITFTPTAAGTRVANLQVFDNASGSPQAVALLGTGVAQTPGVLLNPTSLNFGDQTLSTTSTVRSIILTNTGSGVLTVSSVVASGDFAVVTVPATNCGGSLASLATCSLNVTFTPTATGGRTGAVTVTDNASGSPHVATLSGNGITTKCQATGNLTLSGVATVCQ